MAIGRVNIGSDSAARKKITTELGSPFMPNDTTSGIISKIKAFKQDIATILGGAAVGDFSIASQLNLIKNAQDKIVASLSNKEVIVTEAAISDISQYIDDIKIGLKLDSVSSEISLPAKSVMIGSSSTTAESKKIVLADIDVCAKFISIAGRGFTLRSSVNNIGNYEVAYSAIYIESKETGVKTILGNLSAPGHSVYSRDYVNITIAEVGDKTLLCDTYIDGSSIHYTNFRFLNNFSLKSGIKITGFVSTSGSYNKTAIASIEKCNYRYA